MNRRAFFKGLAALALIPNAVLTGIAKAKAARRPLVFGRCLSVEPVAVDPAALTYQVHDGSVSAIEAVRDRGIDIIIDGDEPTVTALLRAKIPAGHARTCIAEGMVRLGAIADGPVTIDATGDGLRSRVMRMDDLCGAVRYGDYSRAWRDEIDAQGLLVHTWDHSEAAQMLANRFGGIA